MFEFHSGFRLSQLFNEIEVQGASKFKNYHLILQPTAGISG